MTHPTTIAYLKQKQSLSLDNKIILAQQTIREYYDTFSGKVYVAFSGGKDSTVLLHLVRSMYPEVVAVFCDTGLEYPEIKEFIKSIDNVEIIRPKLTFKEVLDTYGYPVISKRVSDMLRRYTPKYKTERSRKSRENYLSGKFKAQNIPKKWKRMFLENWDDYDDIDDVNWNAPFTVSEKCCDVLKKNPFKIYNRKTSKYPYLGIMAENSYRRKGSYLTYGCNHISKHGNTYSWPLYAWLDKDIWDYIHKYNLKYCDIYNKGAHNTGCIFCMFGVHLEKEPNRFQILKKTHPKLWKYCMDTLGIREVLEYIGIPYE